MTAVEWIAGVDGCRSGWVAVTHPIDRPELATAGIFSTFSDVLGALGHAYKIAIDIPIGLPESATFGGRDCDRAARAPLGARQSSVFSTPARAAVFADSYAQACEIALSRSDPPRKVSKQTFNLFAKIREVDALMTPDLQDRVLECHPELAFWRLNRRQALDLPKKVKSKPFAEGLALRRRLLANAGYAPSVIDAAMRQANGAGDDDVLDAFANAATAAAILRGAAVRVPDDPPRDDKGLRMEIWG